MNHSKIARRVAQKHLARQKRAFRAKNFLALISKGHQFGVLSAYGHGSKKENQTKHGELIRDLQQKGYRKIETLKGQWEGASEKSILVPNILPEDLFELGKKYRQDAVVYKSPDGVLGLYFTKGTPKASLAVKPDGEMAYQISTDPDLFSKARDLSFEFGFLWEKQIPWDGRTPLRKDDAKDLLDERMAEA